jgi:hypothetical protein
MSQTLEPACRSASDCKNHTGTTSGARHGSRYYYAILSDVAEKPRSSGNLATGAPVGEAMTNSPNIMNLCGFPPWRSGPWPTPGDYPWGLP